MIPFSIHQPKSVWLVETGSLDVFFIPIVDGQPDGTRFHVLRVSPGELLFGFPEQESADHALFAVGNVSSSVREISIATVSELDASGAPSLAAVAALESWVAGLSEAVLPRTPAPIGTRRPSLEMRTLETFNERPTSVFDKPNLGSIV